MTRVPLTIARLEFRRTVRVVAGDRTKLLLTLAIAVMALGPITAVGALLLSTAGEAVAAGDLEAVDDAMVVDAATGGFAFVWLLAAIMATIRTVTTVADVDEPACLLVSTSLRNVVVGLIGAELLSFAVWLFPPVVILSSAFAYGAGSAVPVALALGLLAVVLVTALPVGFAVGVGIRHLLTVYEPIARYRTPILVGVGLAYFGAIALNLFGSVFDGLYGPLAASPLGWPGHALLIVVPGLSPPPGALLGAAVGVLLLVPAALTAGIAVARYHWFADPARTDDGGAATVESSSRLASLLTGRVDRPTRTVAVTAIRQARRAPVRLLYVAYPLFGAVFFLEDIVRTGTVPTPVAALLALYVVWGAGALFTLNPLGDLGRALPAVMTASVSGRQVVSGLVLAGALVAVPVALVVVPLVGLVSPLSLEATTTILVGAVVGTVVAPTLATGIGVLFPRFGSVRVTSNREAVMASKTAFAVYTAAIALPAGAAAILYEDGLADVLAAVTTGVLTLIPQLEATVSPTAVTVAAWIVLPLGVLALILSYRFAVRRFDGYRLE
ncbi:hypothetical protein ACYJ1Y_01215 [Natrialbaceae archaeon A-gly3]